MVTIHILHIFQNIYPFIGWKIPVLGLKSGSNADFRYQRPRTAIEIDTNKGKTVYMDIPHTIRQTLHSFHNTGPFIGQKTLFWGKNGGQKADFQD